MLATKGILLSETLLPDVEKTYSGLLGKCTVKKLPVFYLAG